MCISSGLFYACKKDNIDNSNSRELKIAPNSFNSIDFNSIDFNRISYENGMLVFESVEHYAQTIDALVEICDQYSANYLIELKEKLGCDIEEADEDIVSVYIIEDNFFPFNPLMEFIELIGFTNSAYPMLRTQEIEWLADEARFEAEQNPFDVANIGYVQSALHNLEGFVFLKSYEDFDENGVKVQKSGIVTLGNDISGSLNASHNYNTNADNICEKRGKERKRTQTFHYKKKDRKLDGILATTSINVRGKTVSYYKNRFGHWILWLTTVNVDFAGTKWTYCDPYNPGKVYSSKSGSASAGLVEKYYTFRITPTYIAPEDDPCITGHHTCKHYSGTLTTQLTHSN
jgi:hypothetical protein